MADILCAVCGEPWDRWGVSHGDITPGEAEMILQGRGCPACEGERDPEDCEDHEMEALQSAAESWDGCPIGAMDRMLSGAHKPYDPTSIKPKGGEHRVCSDCGVVVSTATMPDTHEEWRRGELGEPATIHTTRSGRLHRWRDLDLEDIRILESGAYCAVCAPDCDHCGDPVIPDDDHYTRQEGMTVEHYHADCLCTVQGEEHGRYVADHVDRVMSRHDLESDNVDYGRLADDLGWYAGDWRDPDDDKIVSWLREHCEDLVDVS